MNQSAAVYTTSPDSSEAGRDLSSQIVDRLDGGVPDVVILFASSRFDYETLLGEVNEGCRPAVMMGASSAGEFTSAQRGEGTACALALRSSEITVSAGVGQRVGRDRAAAARSVVSAFKGLDASSFPYRSALVMTDALAGHADDLVEQLTVLTSGGYQFAGGGAGDDAQFTRTHVFCGTHAFTDAVVALELLSSKPLGIGVGHGWEPTGPPLRVTEADGTRLIGLNGFPAVESFERHAQQTGQRFDRRDPLPFFLHNILGIASEGQYRLRVPLSVNDDGSIVCAAEIPAGARVHLMETTSKSAVEAAVRATEAAVARLHGHKPGAAMLFDCVATRLRMGDEFAFEVDAVARMLNGAGFVGCNTYGQIARADGQFGGFHNCTAVVMVLPA